MRNLLSYGTQTEVLHSAALCIHLYGSVLVMMPHTLSMQHLQVLSPHANAVLPTDCLT